MYTTRGHKIMEFGTPSQVNILVYIGVYIFIVAGLIWVATKPNKTKKTKKRRKFKRYKK